MKKIIKISESDLTKIIKKSVNDVNYSQRKQIKSLSESDLNRLVSKVLNEQSFSDIISKGIESGIKLVSGDIQGAMRNLQSMGLDACKAFTGQIGNIDTSKKPLVDIIRIIDNNQATEFSNLGRLMMGLKPEEVCYVAAHIAKKGQNLDDFNIDLTKMIEIITKRGGIPMY